MPKSRTTKNRLQSNSKRTSGSPKQKTQNSPSAASYSALKKRFDAQAEELREALEQQAATTEILRVIASSPTDIQPVLDAIAQSAARVCGSDDAAIRLREGDEMILAAHFGTIPPSGPERRSLGWRFVSNEALLQRKTIHIPDL